jgi:hypothetical protein
MSNIRMIPPRVYHFQSSAEEKIFNLIAKTDLDSTFALHSLNLPEHEYKQWAEADFVIISPKGIIVLEVKGGRVSCDGGLWTFTDRFGVKHRKSESPMNQAKSARFALEERLKNLIDFKILEKINFGFGVIFPDIQFNTSSVEFPDELIFDSIDFDRNKMAIWLNKTAQYWAEKTSRRDLLNDKELSEIIRVIRPSMDLVPSLVSKVSGVVDKMVKLTEDQCRYLDILIVQKRVVIEGGAGTGKTFLAVEACRRLSAESKRVMYLCRSPIFAWHIAGVLQNYGVEVFSLEHLREKVKNGEKPEFELMVIDEGQDFLDMESIEFIDNLLEGGLENGHWLFFMDKNNQGSLYEHYDEDALAFLRSAGIPWPLLDNCRNTKQIAIQSMMYTGGDIGRCRIQGDGLKVDTSTIYDSQEDEILAIEKKLADLLDEQEVQPGDITLLSMNEFDNSVASKLDKRWRRKFFIIDNSFGNQWHRTSLTFSTIRNFKGLENRYIMLIDLDNFNGSREDLSQLYVGMTRANAFLWIATPKKIKHFIDKIVAENSSHVASYLQKLGEKAEK